MVEYSYSGVQAKIVANLLTLFIKKLSVLTQKGFFHSVEHTFTENLLTFNEFVQSDAVGNVIALHKM